MCTGRSGAVSLVCVNGKRWLPSGAVLHVKRHDKSNETTTSSLTFGSYRPIGDLITWSKRYVHDSEEGCHSSPRPFYFVL